MYKKSLKQKVSVILSCILTMGLISTNTAFASANSKNYTITDNLSTETYTENIPEDKKTAIYYTETNEILAKCKEVKSVGSSTELKAGQMVSSFSGNGYCAAVTTDGDLYYWGDNIISNYTYPNTPVKILDNVVSANIYRLNNLIYSAAITTNGDLYCWGNNEYGQIGNGSTNNQDTPVKVLSNVASMYFPSDMPFSTGTNMAITTNGDLYCWGNNHYGQVGNGTTDDQYTPVKILSNVSYVTRSYNTSAAITTNGDLYCWGSYSGNENTNNSLGLQLTPFKILDNVSYVVCSDIAIYNAAITTNGDLYCWGDNSFGQLGCGTSTSQLTPVKVLDNVSSIKIPTNMNSSRISTAITTNGDLYCWGNNSSGQIGNGSDDLYQTTPVKVLSNVSSIENFPGDYCAAITTNGDLYCWGNNMSGQIGNVSNNTRQATPVKVLSNVSSIIANNGFQSDLNAAITTNGDLYCWGNNIDGQVGNGSNVLRQTTPVKVLSNVSSAYCYNFDHYTYVAAITTNKDLYCWGNNDFGRIGNGSNNKQTTPYKVLSNVSSVNSCQNTGRYYTSAITTDGSLYCWGDISNVQPVNGTEQYSTIPVKILPTDLNSKSSLSINMGLDPIINGIPNSTIILSASLKISKDKISSPDILKSEINSIIWTSSDPGIAEITKYNENPPNPSSDYYSGNMSVYVTPYKEGTVVITGKTLDGTIANCIVTIGQNNYINNGKVKGNLNSVDLDTLTVTINDQIYLVSDDFNINDAAGILNNNANNTIIATIKNGRIIEMKDTAALLTANVSIKTDTTKIQYQNKTFDKDKYTTTVTLEAVPASGYSAPDIEGLSVHFDNLKLSLSSDGFYFDKENTLKEITKDLNIDLEFGKSQVLTFDIYIDKNHIPAAGNTTVSTEMNVKSGTKNLSDICSVIIENLDLPNIVNAEKIILDKNELTLDIGAYATLTATISPDNTTNKNIIWTSENHEIATVDNNGIVTAISVGNTSISAKTEDGNHIAVCNVTVKGTSQVPTPDAPSTNPSTVPSTSPSAAPSTNPSAGGGFIGSVIAATQTPAPSPSVTATPKATVKPKQTPAATITPAPIVTTAPVVTTAPETKPTKTPVPITTPEPTAIPGTSSTPGMENDNNSVSGNKLKKGSKITDKKTNSVYKITSTGENKTVEYIKSTNKNCTDIVIPSSVKLNGKTFKIVSIGKSAFKNNKKLKTVKIGNNIKTIGKQAFSGCENLENVKMGKNITTIKANAFNKCSSLTIITIPAKIQKIGEKAFYKCKKLQYILVKTKKLKSNSIGNEAFSYGYSNPRVKTDKSVWKKYQIFFTAKGLSNKSLFIIDPVKLVY